MTKFKVDNFGPYDHLIDSLCQDLAIASGRLQQEIKDFILTGGFAAYKNNSLQATQGDKSEYDENRKKAFDRVITVTKGFMGNDVRLDEIFESFKTKVKEFLEGEKGQLLFDANIQSMTAYVNKLNELRYVMPYDNIKKADAPILTKVAWDAALAYIESKDLELAALFATGEGFHMALNGVQSPPTVLSPGTANAEPTLSSVATRTS